MKRILIASFFVISTVVCHAQYNLQFNNVLTYSGTLNFTSNNSRTWTVPTGKVWKIESMTTNAQFIASSGAIVMYFNLNNTKIKQYTANANSSISQLVENPAPLWLKSGDIIQFTSTANLANGYTCNYFLSIVEFNLTP